MNSKNLNLWIDASNGRLYDGWNSNNNAEAITFRQGDKVSLELHLVRKSNTGIDFHEEVLFPDNCTIRVAVGRVDAQASAGTWTVTFDGSTATIPYDATEVQLNTLFNAMPSIVSAGGVTVSKLSGTIIKVDFLVVGVRPTMAIDAGGLTPSCTSRRTPLKVGSATVKESFVIKVYQTPVAFQSTFVDSPEPVLSLTTLTANKEKRISLTPTPRAGSIGITSTANILSYQDADLASAQTAYTLAQHWARLATARINIASSGISDFYYPDTTETDTYFRNRSKFQSSVSRISQSVWDLTLSENTYYNDRTSSADQRLTNTVPVGYTFPVYVTANGVLKFNSKIGVLSFDTAEVEYLLNGEPTATATLEIEVEDASGNRWTVLQTPCTVTNDLIDQTAFNPISYENSSLSDAPSDGNQYARKDGAWEIVVAPDIAAEWGNIGGILSNQTDLQAVLSGLATQSFVTSQGYITSSALTPYAPLAGATFTGAVNIDDSGSYPFRVTSPSNRNYGTMLENGYLRVGYDEVVYGATSSRSYVTDYALYTTGSGNQSAGIYTNITNPVADPPALRLVETDGSSSTSTTEVKQGRIYYNGVETYIGASALLPYAPIDSPVLTGNPQAPTPTAGDDDTSIATTAFVQAAVAGKTTTQVVATVRNETGTTITKGSVVYINGAGGNKATVALARANAESTSASTYGVVQNDIATNNNGTVVISGVIENIDTSAYVAGTALYLSPTTAGSVTSTKPSAPNHMVSIGVVAYQHANQGIIQLRIANGFEIEELHNVAISAPADKNLIAYESATSLYKNKTAASLGIAELSGATFTGKVVTTQTTTTAPINIGQGTANTPASTVAGDVWMGDNINYRDKNGTTKLVANINTQNTFAQPQTVDVLNNTIAGLKVVQRGTGPAIVVEDGTPYPNDTSAFVVNANGNVGIGVNPAAWTPAEKLEVVGHITTNNPSTFENNNRVATTSFVRNVIQGYVVVDTNLAYQLQSGYPNVVIKKGAPSGSPTTIIVPNYTSDPIPVGTQFVLIQSEADPFTISPDAGVGIASFGNKMTSAGQYAVCTLIKTDQNEWYLAGNLV